MEKFTLNVCLSICEIHNYTRVTEIFSVWNIRGQLQTCKYKTQRQKRDFLKPERERKRKKREISPANQTNQISGLLKDALVSNYINFFILGTNFDISLHFAVKLKICDMTDIPFKKKYKELT